MNFAVFPTHIQSVLNKGKEDYIYNNLQVEAIKKQTIALSGLFFNSEMDERLMKLLNHLFKKSEYERFKQIKRRSS